MAGASDPEKTPPLRRLAQDFSDVVHGEDMEFREENTPNFPVVKRFGLIGKILLPQMFSTFSESQLITIAGAASGFISGVFVCPLDVVKTRFQAASLLYKYSGFLQAFTSILRDEGLRGLYRGVVPVTIGYLPTWAIYFTVYEKAKNHYPSFFQRRFGLEIDWLNHFAASMTAGACSSFVVNPIWVVKTRLMVQTGKEDLLYKGTIDAFKKMYKNEGIRVFYSGLVPSLFGLVHVGIHFPTYEAMKKLLGVNRTKDLTNDNEHKLWRLLLASCGSKMIASTVTYPHEVLRTRMQMQTREERKASGKLASEFKKILHKAGPKGFYAGYVTNLARTLPASAVTLVSFEYFKTYLLEITGKLSS
ncbi:mitochondrial carrier [Metschnikowia bicuspidata var. bicuspidata NRRL YB-4993]|uniref:Mitochondrial carrier n=1 Tax=Metschnikowia bicuspidata var. bicuspidata NRRL YB-4993 TaxID=869754 RepID=A0A1A0HD09_9ASCO|nr:mitochondrial carrier [Metschnikowia bicuspidata var. bicuspidata NRRL YB-4993]OBA21828.1 mitochondrial carrier [Metschnikowia bicuspidata var. bicuspidata NRRL YB-4993]